MHLRLDDDIYTNDTQYFFSLHGLRFEYMNEMMAKSLGKKYGGTFKTIRILNALPAKIYDIPNYIVLNSKGDELANELGKPVVYLVDYEDMNVEFCNNPKVVEIVQNLLVKQDKVFVYPFTTSFFESPIPELVAIGPDPKAAQMFDEKTYQVKMFEELGVPHLNSQVIQTQNDLVANVATIIPCYISAAFSSGGSESGFVYAQEMLNDYIDNLREINQNGPFVVSDIYEDIVATPNVNAIVSKDGKVFTLLITEQVLNGNRYLGNLYPSTISQKHHHQIREITDIIGKHMADSGYRGLFGCDFLINKKGELVVIDLNPRHQGGHTCLGLTLATKGISLSDMELETFDNNDIELSQDNLDTYLGFAWGHIKLAPLDKHKTIINEYSDGKAEIPFEKIGQSFVTEFYKKGSVVINGYMGYEIQTGQSREEVEKKIKKIEDDFLLEVFSQ